MSVRNASSAGGLSRTTAKPSRATWTMMGWFYGYDFTTSRGHCLTYEAGGAGLARRLRVETNSLLNMWGGVGSVNGTEVSTGRWMHLTMTYDGASARAYLNGVLDIEIANTTAPDGTLYIGNDPEIDNAQYLNGRWADLKMWSRTLDAAEIRREMAQWLPVSLLALNTFTPSLTVADATKNFVQDGLLLAPLDTKRDVHRRPGAIKGTWSVLGGTLLTEDDPPIPWGQIPTRRTVPIRSAQGQAVASTPSQMAWQAPAQGASIPAAAATPATPSRGFPLPSHWTTKPPVGAQIDWRHPLAQGLELCYLFNEGQGTILHDLTGRGHDATIGLGSGDPLWAAWITESINGIPGPALQGYREAIAGIGGVDGTNGNMARPLVFPAGSAWSIEFWLYCTNILPVNATFAYLFAPGDPDTEPAITSFSGVASVQWSDGTFNRAHTLRSQAWNHAVMVKRGGAGGEALLDFYINLVYVGSHTILDSAVRWNKFLRSASPDPIFTGKIGLTRAWTRALSLEEVGGLYSAPYAMLAKRTTMWRTLRADVLLPSQMQWQAHALDIPRIVRATPARLQWQTQALPHAGNIPFVLPARMRWRTNIFHRALVVAPARLRWHTGRQALPVGLNVRDCGPEYEAALQRTSIGGDWLISAPALGLSLSFNYEAGGGWEHRIVDISDIEISAPPGGGIASAANVTVSIAETGRGQSIVTLWEQASAVGAVAVTIDFLLAGAEQVLRIFTGSIDSITIKDAVAQILLVDDSIRKNLVLPKEIVTVEKFPNADQAALTKAIPLVYGQGSVIGAAPMLFIDVPNNIYLLAAHPMQVGGKLAVYDQPNKTFLTLDTIVTIPNNGNATITLGTLTTGALRVSQDSTVGSHAGMAIDGNSATLAIVNTDTPGPHAPRNVPLGNGWGFAGWSPSALGSPQAGTLKIDITNHRRSPGSDPTTKGTFWFRTRIGTDQARDLYVSPAFNHVTSAQHDTFILSNVNL
ncbi:MAG TPA: LamG domain-containing protein, partial [Candidatus Tectomicrobia bacterium]